MSKLKLSSPVTELSGVGDVVAEKLAKAKIYCVGDFLFILPNRYQDKTKVTRIENLIIGEFSQILVTINSSRIAYGKQRMMVVQASDSCDQIVLRFFNFARSQLENLAPGKQLLVYGQASQTGNANQNSWAMMHPEYREVLDIDNLNLPDRLSPVYPVIAGIGNNKIKQWVAAAINCLHNENANSTLTDFSDEFLYKHKLSNLVDALTNIHQPQINTNLDDILDANNPDLARIVLDELLAKQIGMLRKKAQYKQQMSFSMTIDDTLQAKLLSQLSFDLTKAQLRVIGDIFNDLTKSTPMHRLIQGDVGSGKTLVAFSSALQAINNGYQVALMAPTEILSEQHYQAAQRLMGEMADETNQKNLGINILWLAGKQKSKDKRQALSDISDGKAQLIIGTHALFQQDVIYQNLGLVIIDEQHRFGVHQRLLLREKSANSDRQPHLLVMTATPIPRTLAMSFYADLDTSIINELPKGRKAIETLLLSDSRRNELIDRVRHICESGQQVYWVCALIDESEVLECEAAEKQFEKLKELLPELSIALLHSKIKPEEKADIMANFLANNIQILVATTVIEVGVDVPNASLMIIENSERFGLSQLHQLRGRVGRGSTQSFCVLLFRQPLSQTARQRLQVIRHNTDGFEIAKEDLKIRGAGEVLGTKQTGEMLFRIANIERDSELIAKAHNLAHDLMVKKPELADEIVKRWVGESEDYFDV